MKFVLIVPMILLATCCVAGASKDQEAAAQDVKYCDLTKSPTAFSGKRIRARAIYSYMFEVSRLKPPECCPERDVAIWIDFSEEMDGKSKKLIHSFPKGMGFVLATFSGVLESSGPYGDGGYRFKLTVDRIDKVEHRANPSPSHHPPWIPNCEAPEATRPNSPSAVICQMGG
jgi:hypothetical protein